MRTPKGKEKQLATKHGVKLKKERLPPIEYPIQTRFCLTKEDFHETHGLSLVGEDPRMLTHGSMSQAEWLSVWQHKHVNNERMHLRSVRPALYEECALLYHKVYQRAPPNCEVSDHFAYGFAYERFQEAQTSSHMGEHSPLKVGKHLVAWAVFAESVIRNVLSQKKLDEKMRKWCIANGPVGTSLADSGLEYKQQVQRSMPAQPSKSPEDSMLRSVPAQLSMPPKNSMPYQEHIELVQGMAKAARAVLETKRKELKKLRVDLDEVANKKAKVDAFSGAANKVLDKISSAKANLSAQRTLPDPHKDVICQLEAISDALEGLLPDLNMIESPSELEATHASLQAMHRILSCSQC